MLYPSLECFCTGVGSSSSSSCFSQQKHRKPARYTALWPRNARNGSITLHHDQYPATVSFKTASTTEGSQTPRTPWPESDVLVCCSCRKQEHPIQAMGFWVFGFLLWCWQAADRKS